jgi:hypothetical protein
MKPGERVLGRVYHNRQDPAGGQAGWSSWQADFRDAPEMFFVTTANRSGPYRFAMQAFGLARGGAIFHNKMESDGSWHEWQPFQVGPRFSLIEAKNGAVGHLEVFGIGIEDGTLYHGWQNSDDEDWNAWVPNFQSAPKMTCVTAAIGTDRNLQVFAIGTDGALYHNWQDTSAGAWHQWVKGLMGAPPVVESVEAVMGASRKLEVFIIGAGGTLYHTQQESNGDWQGWVRDFQGAPRVQSVTAAVGSGPNLQVFAITLGGTVCHLLQDSGGEWQSWDENFLAGPPVKFLKVGDGPHAQLELFAIGTDHTLLRNWQDPTSLTDPFMGWHPWERHFRAAPAAGFLATALGGGSALTEGPHVEVFLISPPID